MPIYPARIEVIAPVKKATVVQAFPKVYSTKLKITVAITKVKTKMYLYSW
jgi:hypothetical protein